MRAVLMLVFASDSSALADQTSMDTRSAPLSRPSPVHIALSSRRLQSYVGSIYAANDVSTNACPAGTTVMTVSECTVASQYIQTGYEATCGYQDLLAAIRAGSGDNTLNLGAGALGQNEVSNSGETDKPQGCHIDTGGTGGMAWLVAGVLQFIRMRLARVACTSKAAHLARQA